MKPGYWIILLLMLVLAAGCGSQDRYEIMDPQVLSIVEDTHWGTSTMLQLLQNSRDYPVVTIIDDQLYFGPTGGLVYRTTSTGYESFFSPDEVAVGDIISGPDGLLWLISTRGRIYYRLDDTWYLETDLQLSNFNKKSFLVDDQGRLLVINGGLWRREADGQWQRQDIPGQSDIYSGWCDYGMPPVFINKNLETVTEGPDGWLVSDPIAENSMDESFEIQINEDGRAVVYSRSNRRYFLNEGDGWQTVNISYIILHMFWLQDELYLVSSYSARGIYHWSGEVWELVWELDRDYVGNYSRSIPDDNGVLLCFSDGKTAFFDGLNLEEKTSTIGGISAFVRFEGFDHILTQRGKHFRGNDGMWEEMGQPFEESSRSSVSLRMVVDDQDKLTFISGPSIIQWDGNSYNSYPLDQVASRFYLQPDGKIVVLSYSQVGFWSDGQLNWVGPRGENTSILLGAKWESESEITLVSAEHLRTVTPETSTITLTFQGWSPWVSAGGPGHQLGCGGRERMVVFDGTDVQDITPHWGANQEEGARIKSLISDGAGGWIAYDSDRSTLLKYDGQNWFDMGVDFSDYFNWWGGLLTSNGDGSYLLMSSSRVFLIELEDRR